jgi:hypothetical protein
MISDDTSLFFQLQAAFEEESDDRASLQTFMVENHDRLLAMIGGRRINWIKFTAKLDRIGFRNSKGGKLSKEVVRVTWDRAKKLHAARSRKKSRRAAVPGGAGAEKPDLFRQAGRPAAAVSVVVVEEPVRILVGETPAPDSGLVEEDVNGLAALRAEMAWRSGKGTKPT